MNVLTDAQLTKVCKGFRAGLIGRRSSRAMCAAATWSLGGYLSFIGIETTVREGDVGSWNHLWLELPDGRTIDITADQFNTPTQQFPKVHVGKPLSIHSHLDE